MKAKRYKIVERASGSSTLLTNRVIACEVSRFANPAYDAFLKGYDLVNCKAI